MYVKEIYIHSRKYMLCILQSIFYIIYFYLSPEQIEFTNKKPSMTSIISIGQEGLLLSYNLILIININIIKC